MRHLTLAAALSVVSTVASAQGFLPAGDIVSYLGFTAPAPLLPLGPPRSGTPVDFVACPERTANGSWVATDRNGYLFSLAGAPAYANRVVRVTGAVAPDLGSSRPGWPLAPIRVVAGLQPCRSVGYLEYKAVDFGPLFGAPPVAVVPEPLPVYAPRYVK